MNELKTAMYLRGVRAVELVQQTGISKQQLSNYINGVRTIGPKMAQTLSGLLGVSEAYLRGVAQRLAVHDSESGETTACEIMEEVVLGTYGVYYIVDHPQVGPMAVILADGTQFTCDDMPPRKIEDLAKCHWMKADGKSAIMADGLPRAHRQDLHPATIDYVVNDKSCQGYYNGFRAHDVAVKQILLDEYGPIVDHLGLGDDHQTLDVKVAARSREGADAERIREACMPYYEPYDSAVVDVAVTRQWEALGLTAQLGLSSSKTLQERLDNRTAAGACHVPYDMARGMIRGLARAILRECLPDMIRDEQAGEHIQNNM